MSINPIQYLKLNKHLTLKICIKNSYYLFFQSLKTFFFYLSNFLKFFYIYNIIRKEKMFKFHATYSNVKTCEFKKN